MKIDAKSLLRMSTASPLHLLRYSAKMHFLPSLCVYLTTSCNYDCFMCESRRSVDSPRQHMDLELFKSLVNQCRQLHFTPRFHFSGLGEPLVYGNFLDVMRICSEAKISWSITTNGLMLKRYANDLINYGCSGVNVSIHGKANEHDEVVGTQGAFNTVKEAISQFEQQKRESKSDKPRIAVNCVVNNRNVDQLDNINEEFQGWPINSITFQHVSYSRKELKEAADFIITDQSKQQNLIRFIDRTRDAKSQVPVHFFPGLKEKSVIPYHSGAEFGEKTHCFLPWLSLRVYPDGKVKMCEVELGDLHNQQITEIVNNKRAISLRNSIRNNQFNSSLCFRCCHRKYIPQ